MKMKQCILFLKQYALNILIWVDQGVNTFIGGSPDETLSARAWREQEKNKVWGGLRILIDGVFFLQSNHCYEAYVSEVENKQLPTHYQLGDENVK